MILVTIRDEPISPLSALIGVFLLLTFKILLYAAFSCSCSSPISFALNVITPVPCNNFGIIIFFQYVFPTNILLTHLPVLKGSNNLTKQVLSVSRLEKNNLYNKTLNAYLKKFNMKFEDINTSSIEEIKTIARKWDTSKWIEDMNEKRSLKIYREFKGKIKEEKFYDNRESSRYLFEARSNTLPLNIQRRHTGGNINCDLCKDGNEDLIHFMVECKVLEHKRNKNVMLKNYNDNKERMVGSILFKEDKEKVKQMIEAMFKYRAGKMIQNDKIETKKRNKATRKEKDNKQKRL